MKKTRDDVVVIWKGHTPEPTGSDLLAPPLPPAESEQRPWSRSPPLLSSSPDIYPDFRSCLHNFLLYQPARLGPNFMQPYDPSGPATVEGEMPDADALTSQNGCASRIGGHAETVDVLRCRVVE